MASISDNVTHESGQRTDDIGSITTAVTSAYKVLGQLDNHGGVDVLGQNDANTGEPVGVQGVVPNTADGYGLATPDDAQTEGVIDTASTDFRVVTAQSGEIDSQNVVLGHTDNEVNNGAVGTTISGGGGSNSQNQHTVTTRPWGSADSTPTETSAVC